jgi:hypothetical protein
MRVHYSTYGKSAERFTLPAYAMLTNDDSYLPNPQLAAICRAIERKTGLAVRASSDGYDPQRGKRHYQLTLGKPMAGGGSTVEGEFWIVL